METGVLIFGIIMFLLIIEIGFDFTRLNAYSCHVEQVKDYCDEFGYGNWNDFMSEFAKVEWTRNSRNRDSFWGDKWQSLGDTYIHASIIKFNKKGMILDYWSFIKFEIFLRRNKYPKAKATVNWK